MTLLSAPRHPIVADALTLARDWCTGHRIDGAPALAHAIKVAATLDRHLTDPEPELIAAALLHDAPFFAPDTTDLDAVLTTRLGPAVAHTVRALEREHERLEHGDAPNLGKADAWTVYAIAADKIVALAAILARAARAHDPAEFWQQRTAFITRLPYFQAFANQARPYLPPLMAGELDDLVSHAERATSPFALAR